MNDSDRLVLTEILKQQHSANEPLLPLDKYFEIFSAEQVLKSRAFDLDMPEIKSGIVGGGNEGGVDSIYLFVNKRLIREDTNLADFKDQQLNIELIVIQSKNTGSFGEYALDKMKDFTENCLRYGVDLDQASKVLYRQKLLDVVRRFHAIYRPSLPLRPALNISYYYATLGEDVHVKVTTRKDLLLARIQELYSTATCNCFLAGAKQIWKWFNQPISSTIPLEACKTMAWPKFGKSYVGLVPLGNFYSFITQDGNLRGHIFEANVRDYHKDATVNKKIGATLDAPGAEDFWWLNNGITIIASDAAGDGDVISITDPLIVNGLQTSYEIFYHFQRTQSLDDARTVLVRIIKTTDAQSIDNIIKATNSQTKIPAVWLHATEEIHRKIEALLLGAKLYYDRRKNFHRNKGIPPSQIVTIPYLAQALAAIVLQRPDDARARPTTVAERYYKQLFSSDCPEGMYAKSAQVLKRVDGFLDGLNIDTADRSNVSFYVAMYVVCTVLRSPHPRKQTIAAIDIGKITDTLLTECCQVVSDIYTRLGADDRAAKGTAMLEEMKTELRHRFGRSSGAPRSSIDKRRRKSR